MATFLWFLGNTIWKETGDEDLPTRLFYINKIMHSLDLFYTVQMPDMFLLIHPVGTIIGRARLQRLPGDQPELHDRRRDHRTTRSLAQVLLYMPM